MAIINELSQHPFILLATGTALQWVFSAFVSTMPDPDANGHGGWKYIWAYRFLHTLAANMDKAKLAKVQQALNQAQVQSQSNPTEGGK